MLSGTLEWWTLLRTIAAVNVIAWLAVAVWLWRMRDRFPPDTWLNRRWLLLLSAGYVLGCGWRSLLPVFDVPRIVMVDSFLSSVIVGRTVATIAELCFAAQWALVLREVARAAGDRTGLAVSRLVLPLIAVAELFSWHAVLTTSNLGHVVEESLWGLTAVLLVASLVIVWRDMDRPCRPWLAVWCAGGLAYAAYMFGVDVPMYWERWIVELQSGRDTLTWTEGFADAAGRWIVSHRWDDWHSEVVWMTAYFSVAVWISITLAVAPGFRRATT